jgi:lysophospholipid acyltransferase (LPLAT)-like uncharacterized protein
MNFKASLKTWLRVSVAPWVVYSLVRVWFGTVRVKILNQEVFDKFFLNNTADGNVVAGSWHRHAIFFFYFFRNLGPRGIMISKSVDGEFTAKIAQYLGYTPIRGSSSRGGSAALHKLIEFMRGKGETRFCGTAVDGPRGPARVMKTGMLAVAKESGAWFVPMACSGTNVITFPKAWDRTIIPKPFSKIIMDFGEPFLIPQTISQNEMERLRERTGRILNTMTDNVDRLCGYAGG